MIRKTLGMALFALIFLLAGYALGVQNSPARAQESTPPPPSETEALFEPFWETWDLLHTLYVEVEELDDAALMEGALEGMLDAVDDPHTSYMNPEAFEMANEDLRGNFEGIGAYVNKDDVTGALIIVSVIESSPAETAGILAGDAIIEVDGKDITHLDQTQMINRVRGPAGSTVALGIRRPGVSGLLQLEVVRANIKIPSVESRMIDDIAYLQLRQFGAQTVEEEREALETLMAEKPAGLVLDLRGNPGGYLQTAVDVASAFMAEGPVLIERSALEETTHMAQDGGLAEDIPMVVLVNQGSASASELLAGALQDAGRATIVGSTTFGKGTVQSWRPLSNGGGVRITISRWYTPEGRTIDRTGLLPDIEVRWPPFTATEAFDPGLEAALRVLQGQTVWPTWPFPAPIGYLSPLP